MIDLTRNVWSLAIGILALVLLLAPVLVATPVEAQTAAAVTAPAVEIVEDEPAPLDDFELPPPGDYQALQDMLERLSRDVQQLQEGSD